MISVLTKNANGDQFHPAAIYDVNFSYITGAGCERAEVLLPAEEATNFPGQMDELRIYDNLDLLWLGRIEDKPKETATGEILITAVGFASHLKDELNQKLWVDTSFKFWSNTPSIPVPETWELDQTERDNNNRIFIRLPQDMTVVSNSNAGLFYRLTNLDKLNQTLFSATWDYETGATYDSAEYRLGLLSSSSGMDGAQGEWILPGAGALSASTGVTFTAGKKALMFVLGEITGVSPVDTEFWIKITNLRINGSSDFTSTGLTADDFVKDIIPNFAPSLSTDFSSISTGGTVLTDFYAEKPTNALQMIADATKTEDWKTGVYQLGSDSKPQWEGNPVNRDTIDWIVSQDDGPLELAGRSIQEVFNEVEVEFLTGTGAVTTLTRTATVDVLDDAGVTRTKKIRVETTSQTVAEAAGDQFLTEFGRPRAKGQMTLHGTVLSRTGGPTQAWFMRPNDMIQIHDLDPSPETLADMTASVVTNGINIFEIVAVEVNVINESVTIQLETPASRLDFELVS